MFSQDFNAELLCLCQLAACLLAADQVIRLFGDGAAGCSAEADNLGVDPVAGEVLNKNLQVRKEIDRALEQ